MMAAFDENLSALSNAVETRLLLLVKIGQIEHLEALRQGRLWARHLEFYKQVEGPPLAHQDSQEGLRGVYQATRIEVRIEPPGQDPIILSSDNGLIGQVLVSADLAVPALCLHAIHTGEWTNRQIGEAELELFRRHLEIPESMSKFGTHALCIYNVQAFQRRIEKACSAQNIQLSRRFVRYVDPERIHGGIPTALTGFVKKSSFKDEREYRYLFRAAQTLPDPFILEVGSLEDITNIIPLTDFNSQIRVDLPSE